MSRRRLEAAIQAGKVIEKGSGILGKVDIQHTHTFDEIHDGVYSLQYSHDGKSLAVGYGDGGIEILSVDTGEVEREIRRHRTNGLAVTCLRFSPKEQQVCCAATSEGKVALCSLTDGTCRDVISEPNNEINCLDFNLEGSLFATAGKDLHIRIYDAEDNQLVKTYEGYSYISPEQQTLAGHAQRVFALKYHPDHNDVFITGGWDNQLKVWDSRSKNGVQRTIYGPHICGDSLDIKGSQILTGSWVSTEALQLWDFTSGKLIQNIPVLPDSQTQVDASGDKKKGEFLYCAQFGENKLILAGGSGTNSVVILNTETGKIVGDVDFGRSVQALDSTAGGQLFALGGVNGKLHLAKLH